MPFVRISLHQGKTPTFLQTLADTIHHTLVDTFEVPTKDRFQVIHTLSEGHFYFSPDYLDIQRSHDLILIEIVAGRPRSTATKTLLYQTLASRLLQDLQVRPEDVMVIVQINTREDWSFGCGLAQMLEVQSWV
ncbi:putative tautomerase YusQ [Deinococcus roseus]|uniref:Tautomerase YusQ n=2 Tax=Deinococcus roseus TaxID=392414 RepID=A0ABQ2CZ19_9DEIO|nr:putative tautomerase YusQ [Deinococcus roseus]